MSSTKMDKMIKIARSLNKVFLVSKKIILILTVAVITLLSIFTVMDIVGADSYLVIGNLLTVSDHSTFLDIGPLTIEFADGYSLDTSATLAYVWSMAVIGVSIIGIAYYALGVAQKILTPMAEGAPFDPSVGAYIRKLAFACLAIGIMQNIMQTLEVIMALYIYDLNGAVQNSQITTITGNFTLDIGFIIVFFVLLLMSYVFHYGEELQRLSDETL